MSIKRFTEEFKLEEVKLIKERQYFAAGVASRLGISTHSLYAFIKKYEQPEPVRIADEGQQANLQSRLMTVYLTVF